jgi:hypothetical protein
MILETRGRSRTLVRGFARGERAPDLRAPFGGEGLASRSAQVQDRTFIARLGKERASEK